MFTIHSHRCVAINFPMLWMCVRGCVGQPHTVSLFHRLHTHSQTHTSNAQFMYIQYVNALPYGVPLHFGKTCKLDINFPMPFILSSPVFAVWLHTRYTDIFCCWLLLFFRCYFALVWDEQKEWEWYEAKLVECLVHLITLCTPHKVALMNCIIIWARHYTSNGSQYAHTHKNGLAENDYWP